jgi:hypothetical protein
MFPLDGPTSPDVGRMKLVVDSSSMKRLVTLLGDVTYWYSKEYFHIPMGQADMYFEAYKQLCGRDEVVSVHSTLPPDGKEHIPQSLIDSYAITRMDEILKYDVLLFCVAGSQYAVPQGRIVTHTLSDVQKGSYMVGRYDSAESRTEIIEMCNSRELTCVVVRALRMDTGIEGYKWEHEYRVPCYYI